MFPITRAVPLPRRKVLEILGNNGFRIAREGAKHTVLEKQDDNDRWLVTFVPRHSEISVFTLQHIIRQSGKEKKEFW